MKELVSWEKDRKRVGSSGLSRAVSAVLPTTPTISRKFSLGEYVNLMRLPIGSCPWTYCFTQASLTTTCCGAVPWSAESLKKRPARSGIFLVEADRIGILGIGSRRKIHGENEEILGVEARIAIQERCQALHHQNRTDQE